MIRIRYRETPDMSDYMRQNLEYLLSKIPNFSWGNTSYNTNIDKIAEIMLQTNNFPAERGINGYTDLYTFITNTRRTYQGVANSINLTEERLNYLYKKIPDFLWHAPRSKLPPINLAIVENPVIPSVNVKHVTEDFVNLINDIKTFIKSHEIYPSEHAQDKKEKDIGYAIKKLLANIRCRITPANLDRLRYLFAHIPNFLISKQCVVLQNRL